MVKFKNTIYKLLYGGRPIKYIILNNMNLLTYFLPDASHIWCYKQEFQKMKPPSSYNGCFFNPSFNEFLFILTPPPKKQ